MNREQVSGIQPELLRWARQSIGLSVEDVARRLKRTIEEISEWEAGTSQPSYPQLEKLAYEIYKRPLAVFFLPTPPDEATPAHEFRTLPDADLQSLSVDTHLHIRRAHAFQLALKELFDGHNPSSELIWNDLSLSSARSVIKQATSVRASLGIGIESQVQWKNDVLALKIWRQSIEAAGIYVFKGSFKQKDISGFCLLDPQFPIIYLNNSATKTRQIFSLLHELVHLLLGMNGLDKQNLEYIERLPSRERNLEKFCNAIAAEILIPLDDFDQQASTFPKKAEQATDKQFSDLANRYGVSREAVLRRFLDQGRVSQGFYERKAKEWASQTRPSKGGDWYASQNVYLSESFAKEVVSRYYRNQFSVEEAADFLGIKAKNFAGLEQLILKDTA